MHTPLLPFLAILGGAVCIGFSPILVRLSDLEPMTIGFYRVALAVPLLLVMAKTWKSKPKKPGTIISRKKQYGALILASFFFTFDLIFWHFSINFTAIANSTLLANLAIVFVTLGAWIFLKQKVSSRFVTGMFIALTGVSLLGLSSLQAGEGDIYGDFLAVCASLFYALYLLMINWMRNFLGTRQIMLLTCTGCSFILLPLAIFFETDFFPKTLEGWLYVIALAWVTQATGQGLITYGMGYVTAALGAVSLLVQPVVAGLIAWILFAEYLATLQLVGAAAVMAGLIICKLASSRKIETVA